MVQTIEPLLYILDTIYTVQLINSLALITTDTKLIYIRPIGIMVRVLTNGPGDRGSIWGWIIPKTKKKKKKKKKRVLDASLLNIQHYKVEITGKWSKIQKKE